MQCTNCYKYPSIYQKGNKHLPSEIKLFMKQSNRKCFKCHHPSLSDKFAAICWCGELFICLDCITSIKQEYSSISLSNNKKRIRKEKYKENLYQPKCKKQKTNHIPRSFSKKCKK